MTPGDRCCRWMSLARKRQRQDLRFGRKRGIWFDEDAAARAVEFFSYLKHWKGEWAGRPFVLSEWQERDIIRPLFGWMVLPAGISAVQAKRMAPEQRRAAGILRRFRTAYIEVPRKNGKTELAAAIGLYLLVADNEAGAEVYSVATHRDQARICWESAWRMVKASPELRKRAQTPKTAIIVPAIAATFRPLASDEDSLEGLGPHGAIIDEYHAHRTDAVYNVIVTGAGARRQPLMLVITTAGIGQSGPCWREHCYAENILSGGEGFRNDSYFAFIASADPVDDWESEETWRRANPNYGVSVYPKYLRDQAVKARGNKSFLNAFKRYHLNLWVGAAEAWIDPLRWAALADREFPKDRLLGRECVLGIDLSRTIDLTALSLVFPPCPDDEFWRTICRFWVPEERIAQRAQNDRVPYDVWAREGWIQSTPGNVVDYDFVEAALRRDLAAYDVKGVGIDPWNATKFISDLQAGGIDNLIEVRQGPISLSAPMKEIERLIFQKALKHDGNPVLAWNMSNVALREDVNMNIAPDKRKSRERIDGVSAMVTAMRLAVASDESGVVEYSGMGLDVDEEKPDADS